MADQPACPQKAPVVLDVEPGTYWWCACGLSKTQPFCDGSHKDGGVCGPIEHKVSAKGKLAWCGCKQTKTPPLCDGSHQKL